MVYKIKIIIVQLMIKQNYHFMHTKKIDLNKLLVNNSI